MEGGLNTLRKLIMTRPAHRMRFLDVLLEFTSSEKNEVSTSSRLAGPCEKGTYRKNHKNWDTQTNCYNYPKS